MSTLGGRLKAARERKGWTQTYVCKKLNIPNSTLSGYERDYRSPDPELLTRLAELYEVTTDYLLGRTDNPKGNVNDEIDNDILDLQKAIEMIEKGKARFRGRKLTMEQRGYLIGLLRVVLEREKQHFFEVTKKHDEEAATRDCYSVNLAE